MRLLELPFEYQKEIDSKKKTQQPTSSASLVQPDKKIEKLIERLKDTGLATFMLVAYPEFTPLNEGYRAMKDLERVGITVQGVLLNQILHEADCPDDFSRERWKLQQHYLYNAQELFVNKPLFSIPLSQEEIIGLKAVEKLGKGIFEK
ncbi:MAG: ArsA-related P-loop ATPase [Bacteroidota bacterium]|nr:ArsA-related P-loop ATPase [Bacteroidota bacterium]